jgi:transposase
MSPTPTARERVMRVREVILKTMKGEYSWIQAADILGLSPRTLRRWRFKFQTYGVDGLLDRRRVERSPRAVREAELKRWFRLYRERYRGYTARHFYALLKRRHGCGWSYSVVLRALQGAGLLPKQRPRGRHFMRREPRPCFGELLHIDGSLHRWLRRGPEHCSSLITVVDDATKRLLYGRLCERESTHAILSALATVVRRHGIPQALYSDRASWAAHTPKAGEPAEQRLTQVGRALERLGVEHILAYSPQARGRSERVNRTLQDRLVKELASAGVATLERANRYLEACFLPAYNDEFARPPRDPASGFAPLGTVELDIIFCIQEPRTVQRDNTVTLEGVRLQIAPQPGRASCAGLSVMARRHLDGTHSVWWGTKLLGRYSPQGRALSREPLVHPTSPPAAAAVA